MTRTTYTQPLPIFKAEQSGICPFCSTFIVKGSEIVRLSEPETPMSSDGRKCDRTGRHYHYNGKQISMRARRYAHWTCYKEVLLEDAEDYEGCWYCESTDDLTIDHIEPTSEGGSDTPGNITVACRSCNSSKGARNYNSFIHTLPPEHLQRILNY